MVDQLRPQSDCNNSQTNNKLINTVKLFLPNNNWPDQAGRANLGCYV